MFVKIILRNKVIMHFLNNSNVKSFVENKLDTIHPNYTIKYDR